MIKGAIIGFGSIAQRHLEGYTPQQDVRIVAVADIISQRRGLARNKLKIDEKNIYSDYRKLMSKERLDFIDICVPHNLHKDVILEAANHGLHILCEKPLAMTLSDIDDVIQISNENCVQCIVCHNYMYFPPNIKAKEIIDDGGLGRVLYFEWRTFASSYFPGVPEFKPSWRATAAISGGGPLLDNALHPCYLANWFIGGKPNSVKGTIDNMNRPEYSTEDFGHAFYTYQNRQTMCL